MSEENIGGEEGIIEERRKKLEILRNKKKAYINDFHKDHYAADIHAEHNSFSKEELEKKFAELDTDADGYLTENEVRGLV